MQKGISAEGHDYKRRRAREQGERIAIPENPEQPAENAERP
jgi:hypothetical protein